MLLVLSLSILTYFYIVGEQFSLAPSFPGSVSSTSLNPSVGTTEGKKGPSHQEVYVTLPSNTLIDISSKLNSCLRELVVSTAFDW